MASKRPAPDDRKSLPTMDADDDNKGTSSRRSGNKRRKPNPPSSSSSSAPQLQHTTTAGRPFKKAHPVNDLKSQIRSLRRLLSKQHQQDAHPTRGAPRPLPANVRVEKERALRSAEHELRLAQRAQTRSAMIGKWHKVRFFERQKASKRLKRARKGLVGAEGGSRGEWEERVAEAEVAVNYAVYFPLEREYVPLFYTVAKKGRGKKGEDVEEDEGREEKGERKGDPEMWELVKRCMVEGTLKDLREGRLDGGEEDEDKEGGMQKRARRENKNAAKRETKQDEAEEQSSDESDNESGGGFFE